MRSNQFMAFALASPLRPPTWTLQPVLTLRLNPPKPHNAATTWRALKAHSSLSAASSSSEGSLAGPGPALLSDSTSAVRASIRPGTQSNASQSASRTAPAQILAVSDAAEESKLCSREITSDAMLCDTCPLMYGRLDSALTEEGWNFSKGGVG